MAGEACSCLPIVKGLAAVLGYALGQHWVCRAEWIASNIQVGHFQRILLNEFPPWLHLVTH
jgi:hypothetical protein